MFDTGLSGSGIYDTNVRFRMYLIFAVGIFALGGVLFWRTQLLLASEYVDMPDHAKTLQKQGADAVARAELEDLY